MAESTDMQKSLIVKLEALIEKVKVDAKAAEALGDALSTPFAQKTVDRINKALGQNIPVTTGTGGGDKKDDKDAKERIKRITAYTDKIADTGVSFLKKTFAFVESIFNQLKKSSPLLQAIEQLFNLAWTLFFMPLGNKLGEMLIPAVIKMMDDVMAIWDAFEGMSLGEMFSHAITKGVEMLAGFISTIGETLSKQSGLVGSIGRMLLTVSGFIEHHLAGMLNTIVNVVSFVVDHLKEIIALIVAFKVASIALQVSQIVATYASASAGGKLTGGAVAAAIGIPAALSIAAGSYTYAAAYAEGGYVPATPGGQLAIIGEGGEGEYIIPESKMGAAGGNTYIVNNYMMSTDELDRHIREIIRGEVSASRLRSGF